eukprot:144067_1
MATDVEVKCLVCRVAKSDHYIIPCMHICICFNCISKGIKKCPTCRGEIKYIIVLPSVNTKSVATWDINDFLHWIKILRQKELFEDKKKEEAATIDRIIKKQKYSGTQLKHCNTQDSFMKLFKHKIKAETARILHVFLAIEREMYIQREQSKRIIKQGKWKPKNGEIIRVVDMKSKPKYDKTIQSYRSYPAIIKKTPNAKIYVSYVGYPDSGEWLKREQWAERITIFGSTLPPENDLKQNDDSPKKLVRVEFEVGQKIEARDSKWFDAIIKEVGVDKYGRRVVRVGWLLDKWASERWDKIWSEDQWDKRIRDPETHLPYSQLLAMQFSSGTA